MLYFLTTLFAATFGSVTGIGGGLIVRPSLSLLGAGIGLASFTSAAAVFVMASISVTMRRVWRTGIELKHLGFLAVGSIMGAFLGAYILQFLTPLVVSVLMATVMTLIGVLLIVKRFFKPRVITNPFLSVALGVMTGFFAGLFGIGGGTLQMIVLMYLFGSKPKEAVVQSLFIAMLASAAALIQYSINGFADFSLLMYVIPAAVLGGLIGGVVSKRISARLVIVLLFTAILGVVASQVYLVVLELI
jgi:uncharacterized membrane protein YfcA